MFIREVIKKFPKSKKTFIHHRLIESHRTPSGPRQKIILHLGTLDIPREKWKDLANTIEALITNQPIMFPSTIDKEVKKLAHHYAKIILKNKLNQENEAAAFGGEVFLLADLPERLSPQYEIIDIHSVENSDACTLGAEHIALSQMKEYNFYNFLKQLNFNQKQIIASAVLLAGRLIHPASELETARWARERSGIGEYLRSDLSKLSDQALHRTGDLLWKHHKAIENYLAEKAQKVYSLDNTILLFDLTNTYFESSKYGSEIARFGKSKEKRTDCPLVTLALLIDSDGFPKVSKIFKGNISEPTTLGKILDELSGLGAERKLEKKTVVIDAGIATTENLKLLSEKKYNYIAVSRKQIYSECFWKEGDWQEIKLKNEKEVLAIKSERTEDEVFLLCHSDRKKFTEGSILESRTSKFEKAIDAMNGKLKSKSGRKKYEMVMEKIGRLKERYKVGQYYNIEITHEKGYVLAVSLKRKEALELKEEMLGNYVLRTNRKDLADEEITRIHRILTRIEQSFKWMKTDLGIRPVHHQIDKRMESHLFITVLSYHMLAPILYRVQKSKEIPHSWRGIKNIMSAHQRVTTTCMTKDGNRIDMRNSTTPTLKQMEIYSILGITPYPLKNSYSKIKINKNL